MTHSISSGQAETRNCQNCKKDFLIDEQDFEFYKKIKVPPPTFCWLCRAQRRLAFRNDRALYPRPSSMSGEKIFSTYPENVPFPVYTQPEWHGDGWDALSYGRDYDFNRPFFEQFLELWKVVPRPAKSITIIYNSDYSNNASDLKNCYLVFNTTGAEDSAYGNAMSHCRNSFDLSHCRHLELSYQNFWGLNSSRAIYCSQFAESTDIYFCKNVRGCNNCFGCVGLRGKSYCFFNEQLTKEEYQKRIAQYDLGSHAGLQKAVAETQAFWKKLPVKYMEGMRNQDVSGGYISMSKNVKNSYLIVEGEDMRYCQYMDEPSPKDCYDHLIWGHTTSLSYECAMTGESNNTRFCLQTYTNIEDAEYAEYCRSSSHVFGCISLENKKYCILNKQYTKEQYEELVPKIRQQMLDMPYKSRAGHSYRYGEFFPPEFSPFGYNETLAQEHFPLTPQLAGMQGFNWKEIERKNHTVTLPHAQIPDHIKDVTDDILKQVLGCTHEAACDHGCTGAFRIIPQELQYLRKMSLALPRICVNCRHRERISQRNPIPMYPSSCTCAGTQSENSIYKNVATHTHGENKCPVTFETTFKPESDAMIYCEQCYNTEMV